MSKHTISLGEPAARPINIDLSLAELHALAAYHKKRIGESVKAAGKVMAKENLNRRQLEKLQKITQDQIAAHKQRAVDLHSILYTTLENTPS